MSDDAWTQQTRERIAHVNKRIDSILASLKWTRDDLKRWHENQAGLCHCRHNARHVIPRDRQAQHEARCRSNKDRPERRKQLLPSSARYFYTKAPAVVCFLDPSKIAKEGADYGEALVHPMVPDAEYGELGKQLLIQHGRLPSLHWQELEEQEREVQVKTSSPSTDQRDYKRRRRSYRVKVSQRTPIEVQRQLVQAYMQEYNVPRK